MEQATESVFFNDASDTEEQSSERIWNVHIVVMRLTAMNASVTKELSILSTVSGICRLYPEFRAKSNRNGRAISLSYFFKVRKSNLILLLPWP